MTEQSPTNEEWHAEAALMRERFFTDPEAIDDAEHWDPRVSDTRFLLLAKERLRRNHPDLALKHDGSNPTYKLENDGSMLNAVWQIMIVRENYWRHWRRQQHN